MVLIQHVNCEIRRLTQVRGRANSPSGKTGDTAAMRPHPKILLLIH